LIKESGKVVVVSNGLGLVRRKTLSGETKAEAPGTEVESPAVLLGSPIGSHTFYSNTWALLVV